MDTQRISIFRRLLRRADASAPQCLFTVVAVVCWLILACLLLGVLEDPTGRLWWFAALGGLTSSICAVGAWRLRDTIEIPRNIEEMAAQRRAEIASQLREPVSLAQARAKMLDEGLCSLSAFEEWVHASLGPGAELWYYESEDIWLGGRAGLRSFAKAK